MNDNPLYSADYSAKGGVIVLVVIGILSLPIIIPYLLIATAVTIPCFVIGVGIALWKERKSRSAV
ncbi:hypothetical protein FACS1894103_7390 [Campylobacterota bacterium]|nr:hypothetical protein FACS1894103_7390 [Campylobacterota bacterium]